MILIDTTLLIDLQRSSRNPRRQDAESWLGQNPNEVLTIPVTVLGEFAEGFAQRDDPSLLRFWVGYQIVPIDADIALRYGELSRRLRESGQNIGANDMWIAATAVELGLPLLTRNVGHFGRVPELEVLTYGRE
jgi:tRNA(fMet)-specific endonuclease VapC